MASPCQFRGRAAIDEGVEVRAIEAQAAYVNPEVFDQLPTELHLDFADGPLLDRAHRVPQGRGETRGWGARHITSYNLKLLFRANPNRVDAHALQRSRLA